MHLKLMAARAAAVVALSCASISITSPVVYADANPNNRGHHYGQLKHQHPVPAPQPPPAPAPAPPPVPKPNPPAVVPAVTHPNAVIAQTNPPPASSVLVPPADLGGQAVPQRAGAAVQPFWDPNLWVVEALLPALLIVWLMLLAASRLLEKRAPAAREQAG